jgi:hypothetical protein
MITSTWAISMPSGGSGRLSICQIADRNVEHLVLALDEEMVVVGDVGVEIGPGAFDGENADHAGFGELMQRVVDGCERNRHAGKGGFLVQFLDGQVPITLGKQQVAKRDTLTRRTQAGGAASSLSVIGASAAIAKLQLI